jgi:thiol-disulfide isomerase/thioredoxin
MKKTRLSHIAGLTVAVWLLTSCDPTPTPSGPREKTSGESVAVEVHSKAPAFAAKTLDGGSVRLADYVGRKVILLEFWSIFCKSCIEEMPHIEDLHRKYGSRDLAVLSINTDVFSSKKVASFLKKANIDPPYPIVRDTRQEIVEAYGVELLPITVIIDREGWIRLYQEGYRPGDERRFESTVRRLLRKGEGQDVTLATHGGVTTFAPSGVNLAAEGDRVTELRANTVAGREVVVGGDRPHLLFFWSLYCKPCREDFPTLAELARRYGDAGLAVYAVNVDSKRLSQRVARFLEAYEDVPCLLDDPEQADGDITRAVGVRATPTVLLLDAEGTVAYAESGSVDLEVLEQRIRTVVGGK